LVLQQHRCQARQSWLPPERRQVLQQLWQVRLCRMRQQALR
jgi:hypothetical protein